MDKLEKELTKNIRSKIREIKGLQNLNSKHPRFKNWHVATLNLLRDLPRDKTKLASEFNKLTFEDTKYHRGRNTFEPAYDKKFVDDLNEAKKILGKLVPKKSKKNNSKKSS